MRDAHRMKEKFDVSLDNRQIVSLLIAGIVVMGAVFVLGVVVGKKLAGNAQTAAAPDLLSALDANAQALQEVQKEPPLTFQDELTRKSGSEPVAPPPEPKPAKPAAPKPTATAAAPAVPAPKPADKPVEKPAEKPAPANESETAMNSADDELAALAAKRPQPAAPAATAPAPVAAPKPAPGKVEEEPVPTRTATPSGGLTEAIAKASQRPTEAVPGGAFTLQLSAFQTREEADRFVARLRDRGYAPYIVAAEVPKKGTWYRVRMGSFPSRDAATRYLADFKRETQLDAFVAGAN
ncbi:SPOR domain-containing protein [Hyalangium rubrum]|uniref:SPOR domain-containing protein n=1 Tax=Hyalangium rubrum TaxID=3103134 RepID=A0ABU5HHU3_9BACT|nr:SPOR domain-containing protein [Hyalangium sp. s54d21]MDY7231640.1 SPOR domain-containing protein [Hyalangium sp. s54d21]